MIPYAFANSFDPKNTKDVVPIFRVKQTNTPFTVKSSGIELKRYTMSNTSIPDFTGLTNLTLIDTLRVPIIGFYSANGAPIGFHYTDNFAFKYSGYFYTDFQGSLSSITHFFKAYGFGYIRVKIGSTYILGTDTTFKDLSADAGVEGKLRLNRYTWYSIVVEYYTLSGEAGFTLLWKNTDSRKYIPVSAGCVSTTQSFLTSTEVKNVLGVSRSEQLGTVHELSFTLPMVTSGSTLEGYYYNTFWDQYRHSTLDIGLKKFNMIEFEAGYYHNSTSEYIKKFIGHIKLIKPDRQNNKLEIQCAGFEDFYKTTLNLNYPDVYDYWNAEYAGQGVSKTTPNGLDCPTTYDGWELYKAFESLSIRAGIDPTLFLKKKTFLNSSNVVISGTNRHIEETYPKAIILDTSINYGNSNVVAQEIGLPSDDEYVMKSNFGDFLFDYINNITDVYGWRWGCNSFYDGTPYLKANNNPYMIINANNPNNAPTSQWVQYPEINSLSGKYIQNVNSSSLYNVSFAGSKINLVIVGHNDTGGGCEIVSIIADNTIKVKNITGTIIVDSFVSIDTIVGEELAAYGVLYVVAQLGRGYDPKIHVLSYDKTILDRLNFFLTLKMDVMRIEQMQELGVFPKRHTACFAYRKPCYHFGTCHLHSMDNFVGTPEEDTNTYDFNFDLDTLIENHIARVHSQLS